MRVIGRRIARVCDKITHALNSVAPSDYIPRETIILSIYNAHSKRYFSNPSRDNPGCIKLYFVKLMSFFLYKRLIKTDDVIYYRSFISDANLKEL